MSCNINPLQQRFLYTRDRYKSAYKIMAAIQAERTQQLRLGMMRLSTPHTCNGDNKQIHKMYRFLFALHYKLYLSTNIIKRCRKKKGKGNVLQANKEESAHTTTGNYSTPPTPKKKKNFPLNLKSSHDIYCWLMFS